jgi:methionyl-tRNA formyltransferase
MPLGQKKIIFAGTPDFSVPYLQALLAGSDQVVAVYTQPDRPKGRGRQLTASPVKVCAEAAGVPVCQPLNFKAADSVATLAAWQADWLVVVAYGLILPQSVLDLFPNRSVNVHASLLPRWRGAAPIQAAILAGDQETGVSIMQIELALDAGPVWQKVTCAIEDDDTAGTLHDRLSTLGADALLSVMAAPTNPTPQPEAGVTYATKISKQDGYLDWNHTASELARRVRAMQPWPVASIDWQGQRLRVWQAHVVAVDDQALPGTILTINDEGILVKTADAALCITRVQLPGRAQVAIADALRGHVAWLDLVGSVIST